MALLIYCPSLIQVQGGSQFHISLDGDVISPYLNGRKEIPPFDGTLADSYSKVGEDGCYCTSHVWKWFDTVCSHLYMHNILTTPLEVVAHCDINLESGILII